MAAADQLFRQLKEQLLARLDAIGEERARLDEEEAELKAYLAVLIPGDTKRRGKPVALDPADPKAIILAALAGRGAGMTRLELMAETGLRKSLGPALQYARKAGWIVLDGRKYKVNRAG